MIDDKSKYFEEIGDDFDRLMNNYDVSRRMDLIFNRLLQNYNFNGKRVLEIGCGTGRFSSQIVEKGGILTVFDIGFLLTL